MANKKRTDGDEVFAESSQQRARWTAKEMGKVFAEEKVMLEADLERIQEEQLKQIIVQQAVAIWQRCYPHLGKQVVLRIADTVAEGVTEHGHIVETDSWTNSPDAAPTADQTRFFAEVANVAETVADALAGGSGEQNNCDWKGLVPFDQIKDASLPNSLSGHGVGIWPEDDDLKPRTLGERLRKQIMRGEVKAHRHNRELYTLDLSTLPFSARERLAQATAKPRRS